VPSATRLTVVRPNVAFAAAVRVTFPDVAGGSSVAAVAVTPSGRLVRRAVTVPVTSEPRATSTVMSALAPRRTMGDEGVVVSRAVLVALGVDWEGRRQVLAVEVARKESTYWWKEFLLRLKERGLRGVYLVASDDHPGLKQAVSEVLPAALWQRCYVHFLRNVLDYLPRKADDDCLQELRWMYERRDVEEARRDLQAWLEKWGGKYPKLCEWVEGNIEETWTFYRLPREHHKHLKSTNVLERFNQELKRRTLVVRIFPGEESCARLVRAVAAEIHEEWMEGSRYLSMERLREQLKKPVAWPLAA